MTAVYHQRTVFPLRVDAAVYWELAMGALLNRSRWPKGTWMKLQSRQVLRAFMQQKGVSLNDLALAAGVSKGFVSHLTSGRRTTCKPLTAVQIARRLDVPLEVLFMPSLSSDSGDAIKPRQTRGRAA